VPELYAIPLGWRKQEKIARDFLAQSMIDLMNQTSLERPIRAFLFDALVSTIFYEGT
jgi:hypothetical protein